LRGLLSLWVVAAHCYALFPEVRTALPQLDPLVAALDIPVDLFFVLSGYVLGLGYCSAAGGLRGGYRRFLAHRIARIFPLQWLVLAGFLACYAVRDLWGAGLYDWTALAGDFLAQALLVQNWLSPALTLNAPSWSASVEWFLYLAFPLWLLLVAGLRARVLLGCAALTLLGLFLLLPTRPWELELLAPDHALYAALGTLLRGTLCFLLGLLLYRLLAAGAAPWLGRHAGLLTATALLALPALAYSGWPKVWMLLPGVLLIAALSQAPPGRPGWFGSRPLLFLGDRSYALYILHYLFFTEVATLLRRGLPLLDPALSPLVLPLALLAMVLATLLAHRQVELPARRYLRRILLPRPPSAATT